MTKFKSNLTSFNQDREQKNLLLINSELATCKRQKISFQKIGSLAMYLQSKTGISRTTFTGNPKYKVLLLKFLTEQGVKSFDSYSDDDTPEMLKIKLIGLMIENKNIKNKCLRLETYIKDALLKSDGSRVVVSEGSAERSENNDIADTSMAIMSILDRLKDFLTIDLEKGQIEDLSAKPRDRVVVGGQRLKPFIKWLKENEEFLVKNSSSRK
ncbi:hypothetical protein GALL_61680 [mine drainage metagenome]|uniref:Uncharacterized protein n=1 Tax=mine drainage metagenome TaxID=410659 RepID=A0A1J5T837_9ZZZZ